MKKLRILGLALALCALPGLALALAPAGEESPLDSGVLLTAAEPAANTAQGVIKEVVEDGQYSNLLLEVDGRELQVNLPDGFTAISAKYGSPVDWRTLEPGCEVLVSYGPQMTMSIPPQSPLHYLIVLDDYTAPAGLYTAEQVTAAEDGWRVLTAGGSLYLTLTKEVWGEAAPKTGEQFMAWFDLIQPSEPAQAVAAKVVRVAGAPAAVSGVEYHGYDVVAGGKKFAGVVEYLQGQPMVPVRQVAEALGAGVNWNYSLQSTVVIYNQMCVRSDTYNSIVQFRNFQGVKLRDDIEMVATPYVSSSGKTYVPAQFFQLLGCNVSVEADGLLHIEK